MKRFTALMVAAAAAAATMLSLPVQAQAQPVDKSEIRVVSWNICGEAGGSRGMAGYCPYRDQPARKMDQVKQIVDQRNADVVMLQEVCGSAPGSHMALLQERLGSQWSIRHAPGARPDGRTDCRGGLTGELGILLAVKGTITSAGWENALPADPTGASKQTLPVLCATVEGWTTGVCTTHIIPGDAARATVQNKNVKAFMSRKVPGNAVIGGDFNSNAGAAEMEPFTSAFDRCIDANTYHGWNSTTKTHSYHRLDHFFTTKSAGDGASRFASCAVDTSRMDTTENEPTSGVPNGYSDHAPIVGVLRGVPRAGDMDGDGKPDMVAIDDEGKLRLYRGYGNGSVTGSPAVIGNGGWSGAAISHRGDWTGNGTEDLVARVGSELRVYPNKGDGTLASPVRIGTGFPVDGQVVSMGDITGDGYPDVIATIGDALWLYAGDPGANPGVKDGVRVGSSGYARMTLTTPGDADGDGRADLLVRDTRDGMLWLYRGQAGGTVGARTEYGHGYSTTNRPLIAGGADANGDGTADMWTSTGDGTGTLMFYAGETNSAGNPVDGTRTVVGQSNWKTIRAIA